MKDETFNFFCNSVYFRAKGFVFTFRIYPRKKVVQLKQKFISDDISCLEASKTIDRVMRVIKSYYNFD